MNDNLQFSSDNQDLTMGNMEAGETMLIPVIHEKVIVEKRLVETGKVKITKNVVEEHEIVNTPLVHEEIDIQTIPINQYVDSHPDPVRYEGDTMIIPVIKEVVVVRILLEKEIHITKRKINSADAHNIVLRKEEVIIDRFDANHQNTSNQTS